MPDGFDPETDCDEYSEGVAAFNAGKARADNPYPRHTTPAALWEDGWVTASEAVWEHAR